MKEKKKGILGSLITFPAGHFRKNIIIFNEKLTNRLLSLQYDVENSILLLRYRQRKVELNTSKKSLLFVTIRHKKFQLYIQLSYTNSSYLRENTHLQKDAAFSHFRLKESSENIIFLQNGNIRKKTKMRPFLSFSQILITLKFFF